MNALENNELLAFIYANEFIIDLTLKDLNEKALSSIINYIRNELQL